MAAHPASSPAARNGWIGTALIAMIALPAALTLHRVQRPAQVQAFPDSTPYGYTCSLLLFLVPILAITLWFLPHEHLHIPRQAFWRTLGLLAPIGVGLDFFFAHRFFVFPNAGATLRIGAPALGGSVPVEEYLFYVSGFMAVLLLYIWLGEYWLAAYRRNDYADAARKMKRLLAFDVTSLLLGIGLLAAAFAWKRLVLHEPGFPEYFAFLVATAIVPSASMFRVARHFLHWQALSLTGFFILLVSLLWEVTLALPYGWWNFRDEAMIGLRVRAWSRLPIEEICLWIAVTYATAIVFEVMKLWKASGLRLREAFPRIPSAD